MIVETGVIAAAGSGTRMLPVTLAYPKELLPIINKPAIHLIIEEFIDSGIKKIVIVTGENPSPLRRVYQPSFESPRGKHKALDEFLDKLAGTEVVMEPQTGAYGNGTPLIVARPQIPKNEGFIYAYGDDLIKSKTPFTRHLIEKHNRTGALVAGVQEVAWEDVVRYGIAQLKPGGAEGELDDVVEKPSREEARSNLAMFGRFLLSDSIIQILTEIPRGKADELWLTDALREYLRRGGRLVAEPVVDGEWLTIGDPVNYLLTSIEYALAQPEIRSKLEPRVRQLLGE
ncbi:MAG TPA: sugar phosphate nucleotidyltransferase [Blastocatellia bacterium]|nr:sugar phosphate nucleotidyltransferase [Blastocatellia bacterium]